MKKRKKMLAPFPNNFLMLLRVHPDLSFLVCIHFPDLSFLVGINSVSRINSLKNPLNSIIQGNRPTSSSVLTRTLAALEPHQSFPAQDLVRQDL